MQSAALIVATVEAHRVDVRIVGRATLARIAKKITRSLANIQINNLKKARAFPRFF